MTLDNFKFDVNKPDSDIINFADTKTNNLDLNIPSSFSSETSSIDSGGLISADFDASTGKISSGQQDLSGSTIGEGFQIADAPTMAEVDSRADYNASQEVESESAFSSAIMSAADSLLNTYLTNLKTAAANDYKNASAKWSSGRKDWFDPSYDTIGSLEEYLANLPSNKDALTGSTLSGGMLSDEGTSGEKAALGIGTLGISAAFDDQEQAEYIWNKGGEGAASGAMSGGWVGAIVGGLTGVLEGALSWASAEDADAAAIKQATEEYQRKYDRWLEQKKKRMAQNTMNFAKELAESREKAAKSKRASMAAAIDTFGKGVIR